MQRNGWQRAGARARAIESNVAPAVAPATRSVHAREKETAVGPCEEKVSGSQGGFACEKGQGETRLAADALGTS